MVEMSTVSEKRCTTALSLVSAVLAIAGVIAIVWTLFGRRNGSRMVDPLAEADKRIDDLERSLNRLQDTFSHIISA